MLMVIQIELSCNILKKSHAVVGNGDGGLGPLLDDLHAKDRSLGMTNPIAENLCKAVMPKIQDIVGKGAQQGEYILFPDILLIRSVGDGIDPLNTASLAGMIASARCVAFGYNVTLHDQHFNMSGCGLPGNGKFLYYRLDDIGRMRRKSIQDVRPDD